MKTYTIREVLDGTLTRQRTGTLHEVVEAGRAWLDGTDVVPAPPFVPLTYTTCDVTAVSVDEAVIVDAKPRAMVGIGDEDGDDDTELWANSPGM